VHLSATLGDGDDVAGERGGRAEVDTSHGGARGAERGLERELVDRAARRHDGLLREDRGQASRVFDQVEAPAAEAAHLFERGDVGALAERHHAGGDPARLRGGHQGEGVPALFGVGAVRKE
jgi:hypothetical protein